MPCGKKCLKYAKICGEICALTFGANLCMHCALFCGDILCCKTKPPKMCDKKVNRNSSFLERNLNDKRDRVLIRNNRQRIPMSQWSDGNIRLPVHIKRPVRRMHSFHGNYFDRDGHPGPTERKYFTTKMEAEYVGYYLGNAMLTKGTTGLGVIQKPLRDRYFNFRKSSENRLGPEIGIRVNPAGLTLMFPGSHPGEENDGFYELPSIHFIEAVRYVVVKEKDKKFYGAFLPIDEATAANCSKEKLFQQIDKKFSNLTKISHPAMLACVMRRPTGVKAVDCHMIVIPVVEDALQIADMVHRFQDRPPVNSDYYRGGPVHSPRGRPEMYPNPDVIPRNFDQRDVERRDYVPRDSVNRDSEDPYSLYRGRGFELKQEHFRRSNDFEERRSGGPDVERNRSFERDRQFNERVVDERQRNEYNDERNRYYGREDSVEMRSREMRTTAGFVERDSFGHEYEFDNAIPQDRRRYGEEERGRINSERAPVSPRNIRRPERHSDSAMRYSERPSDVNRGPSWGRDPRDDYPSSRHSGEDMYSRGPRPGHLSPRGRSPPRADSPPRGHSSPRSKSPSDDGIYSASNLESRLEVDTSGKPIAKVPPHRHAGVRVLPSLPLLGAKNQLKPVSPRPEETPKVPEKPPTYNTDFDAFHDDEEENPYDNAKIRNNMGRQERMYSDQSQDFRRSNDNSREASRGKSDSFNNDYNHGNNNTKTPNYSSNAAPIRPWSFDEEKEKFMRKDKEVWNTGYKSKSTQEFQDRDYGNDYQSDRKPNDSKDAEIANMFSYLDTGNQAKSDVDFERSLGYLP